MALTLTLRDRAALVVRALAGSLPTDPNSVGGRLLTGVIQPGGTPPPRGIKEQLASYAQMPWLRAVVSRVSFDVASTQWQLYVKRKGGPMAKAVLDGQVRKIQSAGAEIRNKLIQQAIADGDLQPIDSHPMIDLLDNFNVMHTGLAGRRVTQQHLDLVGEAFWLIERGQNKMPVALWPVPPSWILGTPTVSRPFFRVSFRGWQGQIPETEFVWFSETDPANPYGRGTGTAQSLGDELETDEYAARHVKAFFFNRARPDLIVSPKGDDSMQPDEVSRLEEGWTRQSSGFWRGFKPFFLRRAVDVKELDQNLRAQQFVQLREFERNTVIQTFGVSPEIFGINSGPSNRATVSTAEYIYARRVLVPRLELMRTTLQERFVPEFDERLILHYDSPIREDTAMELDAAKAAPWALSVDEWRARMGADPIEGDGGHDTHMAPANLSPISFKGAEPKIAGVDDPSTQPPPPTPFGGGGGGGQQPAKPKPGDKPAIKPKGYPEFNPNQPRDDHGQFSANGDASTQRVNETPAPTPTPEQTPTGVVDRFQGQDATEGEDNTEEGLAVPTPEEQTTDEITHDGVVDRFQGQFHIDQQPWVQQDKEGFEAGPAGLLAPNLEPDGDSLNNPRVGIAKGETLDSDNNHVNAAWHLQLGADGKGAPVVFKPETGESWTIYGSPVRGSLGPEIGSKASQAEREVLAYRVDRALGLGLTPHTEYVRENVDVNGEHGEPLPYYGSAVQFVPHDRNDQPSMTGRTGGDIVMPAEVAKLAVFDSIIGNTDRHHNNYIIQRDDTKSRASHLVAIDNGLSFPNTDFSQASVSASELRSWAPSDMISHVVAAENRGDKNWYAMSAGMQKELAHRIESLSANDEEGWKKILLGSKLTDGERQALKARAGTVAGVLSKGEVGMLQRVVHASQY